MATGTFDLKAWALIGAQQRLRELDQERAAILAAFPRLRVGATGVARRGGTPAASADESPKKVGRKRRRRRMSADARRRISEAQKKRWAKQKGAKPGRKKSKRASASDGGSKGANE